MILTLKIPLYAGLSITNLLLLWAALAHENAKLLRAFYMTIVTGWFSVKIEQVTNKQLKIN